MVSCKIEIPTQPYIVICRLLLYFEYLVHEHVIVIDSNYACCILIVHGFVFEFSGHIYTNIKSISTNSNSETSSKNVKILLCI